jgi:hypothetical protein
MVFASEDKPLIPNLFVRMLTSDQCDRMQDSARLRKSPPKFAVDDLPELPKEAPQRTAGAVRRALPSLLKLQRY